MRVFKYSGVVREVPDDIPLANVEYFLFGNALADFFPELKEPRYYRAIEREGYITFRNYRTIDVCFETQKEAEEFGKKERLRNRPFQDDLGMYQNGDTTVYYATSLKGY